MVVVTNGGRRVLHGVFRQGARVLGPSVYRRRLWHYVGGIRASPMHFLTTNGFFRYLSEPPTAPTTLVGRARRNPSPWHKT